MGHKNRESDIRDWDGDLGRFISAVCKEIDNPELDEAKADLIKATVPFRGQRYRVQTNVLSEDKGARRVTVKLTRPGKPEWDRPEKTLVSIGKFVSDVPEGLLRGLTVLVGGFKRQTRGEK